MDMKVDSPNQFGLYDPTYDPLVARNAHLNINVFGARIAEYVEDMYGETESPLHQGIGTDRFIVFAVFATRGHEFHGVPAFG